MMKTVGIRMPEWLHTDLEEIATETVDSVSAIVRRAVIDHLEKTRVSRERASRRRAGKGGQGTRRHARGRA